MASVFAAADIGSNTAHLLVAATDGQLVMRLDNVNEWIPLGEEVARTGLIASNRIEELIAAMKEFKRAANNKGAERLYVFATEAVRSASNHVAVLRKIKQETGVAVEIISPAVEAKYGYLGCSLDTGTLSPNFMIEVGGGSAQLAVIENRKIVEEVSLPLGTGRVIAECSLETPCPPEILKRTHEYVQGVLAWCELETEGRIASASGGVARGLWRALHPDGEKKLEIEEIEYVLWSTARLPTPRIIERFTVKPKRAMTLLPGAIIYSEIMKHFGLRSVSISEFGVREGAILEMCRIGSLGTKL